MDDIGKQSRRCERCGSWYWKEADHRCPPKEAAPHKHEWRLTGNMAGSAYCALPG